MTFSWRKTLFVPVVALLAMGQSCSISLGSGAGADGGVFRSDDHGQTWHQRVFVRQDKKNVVSIANVTVRSFAFEPGQSDHLYIGTRENGIWQSPDAGEHWQATSLRSGDYPCFDFDPQNHDIMYTAAGSVVLKSTDAGKTWSVVYTEAQPGQALTCVAVDPADGRFVWSFSSGGKILRSEDYGQTWTLQHVIEPFDPRYIYVAPDGSGRVTIFSRTSGIFVGASHGTVWTKLTSNLDTLVGATDIRDVDIHPSGWYIATAYGLLRSVDQGANWTLLHTLVSPGSVAIQNVAVNPRTSQEIFITVDQKLQHTVDGGTSWSVTTLPTSRVPVFLRFDPTNDDVLYVSTFKPTK